MKNSFMQPRRILNRAIIKGMLIERMKRKHPEQYEAFMKQQQEKMQERKYWFI